MVPKETGFSLHLCQGDATLMLQIPHPARGSSSLCLCPFSCADSSCTPKLVAGVRRCHGPVLRADSSIPPAWLQLLHPGHSTRQEQSLTFLEKQRGTGGSH